ncbi:MAG: hypothetical protein JRH20_26435 [Deltaproteobacteria bacterium]|nr:hypothetical protein [Deltaproteobacteria bacterium]
MAGKMIIAALLVVAGTLLAMAEKGHEERLQTLTERVTTCGARRGVGPALADADASLYRQLVDKQPRESRAACLRAVEGLSCAQLNVHRLPHACHRAAPKNANLQRRRRSSQNSPNNPRATPDDDPPT